MGPPPGPAPEAAPVVPSGEAAPVVPSADAPPVPVDGAAPQAAPASFGAKPGSGLTVAVAEYNPRTGEYVGSNGKLYTVTNLVAGVPLPKSFKDLMPH